MHRDFTAEMKGYTYDDFAGPYFAKNMSGSTVTWYNGISVDAGETLIHPGYANQVTRFTSPASGLMTVTAALEMADGGSNTFRLFHNGVLVVGSEKVLSGRGSAATYSGNVLLAANDTLDFVGYSNGVNSNAMFVDYKVQAVPEPASMAALGLGALGLLKRRRK